MADGGSDIIIKGGSVELTYDGTVFKPKNGDPKGHEAKDRKITKIVVIDQDGTKVVDEEHAGGLKWEIRVTTKK